MLLEVTKTFYSRSKILSLRYLLSLSFINLSLAGCLEPYLCKTFLSPTSFIDLSVLCNNGSGYQLINGTTGVDFRFEICGSIDPIVPSTPTCGEVGSNYPCVIPGSPQTYTYCNPEYNAYPFVGSFLQFFDPNPPLDCTRGACPNYGSLSPVIQNQQGYCCTGQCEVIDVSSPIFVQLINPSDVNSGVTGSRSLPPVNGDEFQCPIDPYTGNPRGKSVTYEILCNPNGTISDSLEKIAAYDNGSCKYTLILRHFAACSTSIVPTSSPSPSSIINTNAKRVRVRASNSFSTSVPLTLSLATFLGKALAGILLYTCNRLRNNKDDSKERLLPVMSLDNPISSTTNIAVSRGEEDEGTIESKRLQYGYGGGVVVQPYQESARTMGFK